MHHLEFAYWGKYGWNQVTTFERIKNNDKLEHKYTGAARALWVKGGTLKVKGALKPNL